MMGFNKESYTEEYFLNRDKDGNCVDYGALGADEWLTGGIFGEIKAAIDLVPLQGKRVFEIGYGRGESIRYMCNSKGIDSYAGVDFSDAAYSLTTKIVEEEQYTNVELYCGDALEFLQGKSYRETFDVIFLLDAIEHIPATEMDHILPLMWDSLVYGGCVVIDTPFYAIDEDFIAQGYKYHQASPTDQHQKTRGMHCNKYSRSGLLAEMGGHGFYIVSDQIFRKKRLRNLWRYFNRRILGRRIFNKDVNEEKSI
jgi:2-polyprenyl-3-methyl-5-hydroxy-6-metoxy-1,4-benzoquinol methylase